MTAHKSESPAATGLIAEQTKTNSTAILRQRALNRNEFNTLRARDLAERGGVQA